MNKEEKACLEKFFQYEWCPLFGVLPEYENFSDPMVHRFINTVEKARNFLGGAPLGARQYLYDSYRQILVREGICSTTPASKIVDPYCPSIDEIKNEVNSIYRLLLELTWRITKKGPTRPDTINNATRTLMKEFKIDDAGILAARDLQKQMKGNRDDKWNNICGRAKQIINGAGYAPKKKRTLHAYLDDDQALAIFSILMCYSAMKKIVMKGESIEFFMGFDQADIILNRIIEAHVGMSKRVVWGIEGKKVVKKVQTPELTQQKYSRWQRLANEIWNRKNHSEWGNSRVAGKIKEEHPRITEQQATIAKQIRKPDF